MSCKKNNKIKMRTCRYFLLDQLVFFSTAVSAVYFADSLSLGSVSEMRQHQAFFFFHLFFLKRKPLLEWEMVLCMLFYIHSKISPPLPVLFTYLEVFDVKFLCLIYLFSNLTWHKDHTLIKKYKKNKKLIKNNICN